MDERIYELAEQAGIHPTNFEPDADIKVSLEKFAELIVAECMRMCDVAAIGYDSHGHTKEGNGCAMAREYIKEHFGVEE